MYKSGSRWILTGIMCFCFAAPTLPTVPIPRYAQMTVKVHRYEGGAFVVEKLKAVNANAGVACRDVEDPGSGTVFKSDRGFFVSCGYGLETSRLPSKNIIEIWSMANTR